MKAKNTAVLALAALIAAPAVYAEVYSCGPGCYTSSPSRGSGKADLGGKIGSYTSAGIPRSSSPAPSVSVDAGARNAAHRRAPVVSGGARSMPVSTAPTASTTAPQRLSSARAGGRRTILEQELNNERTALANAQKALAAGRSVNGSSDAGHQARIRQLESAVLDRQQNIQALQRELGRM